MDTLVTTQALAANLDDPDWLVADCRFSLADADAGRRAYDEGHIPGAIHVDLDKQLSSPHIPGRTGRHPLPDKQAWIQSVSQLGITPGMQVVAYDDAGGAMAARLWWMLRWIGHQDVALLDGGWQAWQHDGLPVSAEPPAVRPAGQAEHAGLPSLALTVSADDLDPDAQCLVDARDLPRFRGDTEPLDPVAGHIPGAICSPFSANLDADGRFLPPEALREKFDAATATGKPVVCYCGSGVTATHNILAMKIAGLPDPLLYPGSWSEWITDPDRPVATGD